MLEALASDPTVGYYIDRLRAVLSELDTTVESSEADESRT